MRIKVSWKRKIEKSIAALSDSDRKKFSALVDDLKKYGPVQLKWQNYSKLTGSRHHCHLSYRTVAVWNESTNDDDEGSFLRIEVTYVGSREGAPY